MKKLLLFTFTFAFTLASFAQNLWKEVPANRVAHLEKFDRDSNPMSFKVFNLNFESLQEQLQGAPDRNSGSLSNVVIAFPNKKGELENFRIYEASVMADELQAAHTNIKSYVGVSLKNASTSIRFSTTIFGLHTMMFTADEGVSYIDTYTKDLNYYIAYKKEALFSTRTFECSLENEVEEQANRALDYYGVSSPEINDGLLRTYRLAMACTIEYAAYHVTAAGLNSGTLAQKKAAVLAAMVVTMTRVNGLFERDMSLTMELVANNESIIFIDSDNFSNDNANALINESQTVIDANIGLTNYDIGHTVSTGGGGLAQLYSPCSNNKARGITGSPAPVGDAYDVDYVAHEMGHQFGATHTFNGLGGNCTTGTRTNATAVEPGSGNTIMGYAGICPGVNVQSNSDDHFHAVSIAQMTTFVSTGGNCAVNTANGNSAPVVNAGADYTIPFSTPFVLNGSATDADGDSLTYCWEQTDNEISTQPPVSTNTGGPNYKPFSPTSATERYFPQLSSVLNNNLTPTWEVTPSVARTMDFALTVRDNQAVAGGQTNRDDMTVTVSGFHGPFDVTSQNTAGIMWSQGETRTITWDVNNTNTLAGSSTVDILLSIDGGQTFNTVLASGVANDGSQDIIVPNTPAPYCRVMVKPTGNIYYDVNTTSFAIDYLVQETCTQYTSNTPLIIPDNANSYSAQGLNVTDDITFSSVKVGVNITHTYLGDLYLAVLSPDGTQVNLMQGACSSNDNLDVVFSDAGTAVVCASPTVGEITPLQSLSAIVGENSSGTWTFGVADIAQGDTGTLNSWYIELCSTQETPMSTENVDFANFNVFPNPNNGTFNIQLQSNSSNDITVGVYDIRGRQIFDQMYGNNGSFNQEINLSNVQPGVYLVTVSDGVAKQTKKIVIQ